MTVPAFPEIRMTERTWQVSVLFLSVVVILITIWCLTHGITTIFMHLYYFPIVLLAYHYRWKGFGLATLLAAFYLGLVLLFDTGQPDIVAGAVLRFLVFVGIAAVIAWLSDMLSKAHQDQKAAADKSFLQQQFQESVIANANIWISVLSPNGTILVWNNAAEAISGYKKTDVVGKNSIWKQLYPDKEYRLKVTHEIQEIIARDNFLENFETEIECADGTKKFLVWNTRGMRDVPGTVTSYIAIGRDVTAQKSAEFRAGESSRFLGAMIDTLPVPIFFKDISGKFIGCNPPFEEYIGIKRENLRGKTVYDISPKDLADSYASADKQLFDHPVSQRYETQVQYADGTRHDVIFYKAPFFSKDGTLGGLLGTFIDITDRKKSEIALRESEEKYRLLAENATDIIWILDPATRKFTYFSPSVKRIRGYSPEEAMELSLEQTFTPEAFVQSAADLEQVLEQEKNSLVEHDRVRIYEYQERCKDGSVISTETMMKSIRDADGNPVKIQGITRDISLRKQAEEALLESEEKYRSVIDNIQDLFYRSDEKGVLIMASPSLKTILGYDSVEEALGKPITEFYFRPGDRRILLDALQRDGSVKDFEVTLKRKDGRPVPMSTSSHFYYDKSGRFLGIEGVLRDITERKNAEHALRDREEKYRAFFTTSMDCVFITTSEGKWIDFNDAAIRLFGYANREDLHNARISDLYADPAARNEHIRYIEKNGYSLEYPVDLKKKDGAVINTLITTVVRKDPQGNIIGFQGTIRDISEKKATQDHIQALLRVQEEQLRIINTSPAVAFLWRADENWPVEMVSENISQFGYTRKDFLSGSILYSSIIHPDDLGRVGEEVEFNSTHNIDEYIQVYRIFGKDGSEYWIEDYTHIRRDTDGRITHYEGVILDVTVRKKVELALRESEHRHAKLLAALPDMMFIISREGVYLDFSIPDSSEMVHPADQLLGKNIRNTGVDNELADKMLRYIQRAIETKTLQKFEYELGSNTGARMYEARMVALNEAEVVTIVQDVTERKRVEQALRESRQLSEDIISFLPDPTFVIDRDGKVLAWNRALEQLSGVPAGDIIGKGDYEYSLWMYGKRRPVLIDLVLTPDRDSARINYINILWDGNTVTAQAEILLPGGRRKLPILAVSSLLMDAEGKVTGAIESIRDISLIKEAEAELARLNANLETIVRDRTQALHDEIVQRKYAEQEVQDALSYTRSVIEANPDLMVVLSNEGTVQDINATGELLTGITREKLIGTNYFSYLVDDGTHAETFSRLLHTGHLETQIQIIRNDGHITPVSVNATVIRGKEGTADKIIVSAHDITRQQQDEEALRSSQQMLSNILENFPGVVFWKDKNSVYLGCNKNFSRGAGLANPLEIVAKTDLDLPWAKTEAEIYRSYDQQVMKGGKPILNIIETQLQSDGRVIWLDTSKVPLLDKDGNVIGILGTSHDITRQKQDEAAIRAALDEQVLLLREVHHRVKNNLQIIISLTNLQMRKTTDPGVKQIMAETQNRVRAMSLVHEKLYRSESLSQIDFADYTRFLAAQLLSFYSVDSRRVKLDFSLSKIMVHIETAVPLGLIMNEIVSNSLKHAFPEDRSGTISISGGIEGTVITLVVHDDGVGIPADLDWKNTDTLGMRLITSLIDQVDGTLDLKRDGGTTFSITLKKDPASKGTT
jgi:PAS domain S-box-containing protein